MVILYLSRLYETFDTDRFTLGLNYDIVRQMSTEETYARA